MEFWMLYLDALVPWFHHSRMGGLDIENITWKDTVLWAHGSTITGALGPWDPGPWVHFLEKHQYFGSWAHHGGDPGMDLGYISCKGAGSLAP